MTLAAASFSALTMAGPGRMCALVISAHCAILTGPPVYCFCTVPGECQKRSRSALVYFSNIILCWITVDDVLIEGRSTIHLQCLQIFYPRRSRSSSAARYPEASLPSARSNRSQCRRESSRDIWSHPSLQLLRAIQLRLRRPRTGIDSTS